MSHKPGCANGRKTGGKPPSAKRCLGDPAAICGLIGWPVCRSYEGSPNIGCTTGAAVGDRLPSGVSVIQPPRASVVRNPLIRPPRRRGPGARCTAIIPAINARRQPPGTERHHATAHRDRRAAGLTDCRHSGECSLLGGLIYPADPTTDTHTADQADPMTKTVEDRLGGLVRTAITCYPHPAFRRCYVVIL
jgi:hypothetical protein